MKQISWTKTIPSNPFDLARTWKIAASAGCGKTFMIQKNIEELLQSGVMPCEIMYVTFNRQTAAEFRSRFEHFSEDDMTWWATHHAICYRLMQSSSTANFKHSMSKKEWGEFGKRYGYDFAEDEADDGQASKDLRNSVETRLLSCEDLDPEEERFLKRLRDFEAEHGVKSFMSMLVDAMSLNLFPDEVSYIFIDEAQDNGLLQNNYWERQLENTSIKGFMLVGDDKQAVNGFKGGNAEAFLNFETEINVAFDTSFRCPKPVLDYANRIAQPITNRSPLVDHSSSKNHGSVEEVERLEYAIDEIITAITSKKTVFILAFTNRLCGTVRGCLSDNDIPVDSAKNERVRRIFRAFDDIRRTGTITKQELDLFNPFTEEKPQPGNFGLSCKYFDKGKRKNILTTRKELDENQTGFLDSFEQTDGPIACPIDQCHRLGFTDQFINDVMNNGPDPICFLGGAKDPLLVRDWIRKYGTDYGTAKVMTFHGSKGAEADLVILLKDSSSWLLEKESEQLDEKRRVCYVGATRTRDKLIVTMLNPRNEATRLL